MTFVYEFDPEDEFVEDHYDFSPFTQIKELFEPSEGIMEALHRSRNTPNIDDFCSNYSIRVINSFNSNKKRKTSEGDQSFSVVCDNTTFEHINSSIAVEQPQVDVQEISTVTKQVKWAENSEISPLDRENSDQVVKELADRPIPKSITVAPKSKAGKKRKRKNLVVKRDKYKKRKDVVMKGVLRRCRKYYQEKYTDFVRAQFLANSENNSKSAVTGLPDNLVEDGTQQLTKESLQDFWRHEFKRKQKFFHVGALIFPEEFKKQIQDGAIEITPKSKREEAVALWETIQEVLYKFSYQKLDKFCSIPEMAYYFIKFYETAGKDSEIDHKIATMIKDKCEQTLN